MFKNYVLLALFFFSCALHAAPVVTSVSPSSGSTAGGTLVTIKGSGFLPATTVNFDTTPVVPTVIDDSTITVTTPAYIPSAVNITVTDGVTASPIVREDIFTFTGGWTDYVTNGTSPGNLRPIALPSGVPGSNIMVGFFPQDVAITPNGLFAVVPNGGDGLVSIVNLASKTLVTNIALSGIFPNPQLVAISADGLTAYIGDVNTKTIERISLTSFTEVLPSISIGETPAALAVTRNGAKLYVACNAADSVLVIDLFTNTISTSIAIPGSGPFGLAITPDQSTLYVIAANDNTIRTINIADDTLNPTSIAVGSFPVDIAISSDGTKAYVINNISQDMSIINISDNTVTTAPLSFSSNPTKLALTPDNQTAAVLVGASSVEFINLTNFSSTSTPVFIPFNEVISPDEAPVAAFTADTSTSTVQFDASHSISPVGTVVSYTWDFGDSTGATLASPTTSHAYAAAGVYNVRLTVTNSAGTSTTQLFTGQTMSNNGNDFATVVQAIQVGGGPTPPSSLAPPKKFKGHLRTTKHHHLKLKSNWSKVDTAVSYQIFKADKKIKTVKASKKRTYIHRLHPISYYLNHHKKYKKRLHHLLKIRAVDASGTKSSFKHLKFK